MSAGNSQSRMFGPRSSRGKAVGAVLACAALLLAGCGGSGGSAADAPVVRGDAPVAADAALTVSNSTTTGTVGTPITLTYAGGSSTGTVVFASSADCTVSGTSLAPTATATAPVTCSVTATQGTQTSAVVTFTFTAAAVAPGPPLPPTVVAGDHQVTVTVAAGPGGIPSEYIVNVLSQLRSVGSCSFLGSFGSCVVTSLPNDVPYTVTASATNIAGTSVATEALTTFTPTKPTEPSNVATVKFNTTEGTNASMPDQKASTPTALRANGYWNGGATRVFIGWATAKDGEVVYADKATYAFDKDATLWAVWRTAGEAVNIVAKLTGPTSASVTFQAAPKRDGTPAVRSSHGVSLIRGGWIGDEDRKVPGVGTYSFNLAPGNSYAFRVDGYLSNAIVTPAATANLRSVEFYKAVDVQGTMLTMWASEPTALPMNVYSLDGYKFAGWAQVPWNYQMPQPGTLAYADGATYPFTSSIVLYPRWVGATTVTVDATVTFDPNNGDAPITSQSASKATQLTPMSEAIKRTGYTFNGWATSPTGSVAYADEATYPFTADATLYAKWGGCLPLTVTASAERLTKDRAKVRWTASSSESPWTTFMVTTVGGGWPTTVAQSSDTGSKTVTGLMPFQSYTFTVKATNEAGCSYTSAQTNRVAAVS